MKTNLAGVVLAAGKGTRMKSKTSNKVTLLLGNKPIITHGVDLLKNLQVSPIVVVVGFAKESVKKLITEDAMPARPAGGPAGRQVIFAEQKKRLGTAHALSVAFKVLPQGVADVLVIQGDDSAFYKEESVRKLIQLHRENNNSLTFLTVELENPEGLGRIIRDKKRRVVAIVEEKDATGKQRKITEINPACYVFSLVFLKRYLPKVKKSSVTNEYYLVSLIELAIKNKEKMGVIKGGFMPWRGVNTKEELKEAQALFQKVKP